MSKTQMLYIPISKVDEEKRLVYGTLALEEVDHSGEILDYDASKAAFQEWTDHYMEQTDGKSAGNLRLQHSSTVAGKFVSVEFDDANKRIPVVAKVVDDASWKLVKEGCLTGFSIGAKAAWRKKEKSAKGGDITRYAVKQMTEGSIVDAPCLPNATFEYVKSNGTTELRKFIVSDTINSETAYVSAVSIFHDTFRTVSPMLNKVGASDRTLAAYKTLSQSAGIKKSMWDVSDFACALSSINQIRLNLVSEAQWEGDNSPIPEALRTWVDAGSALLSELVSEETSELTQDSPAVVYVEMAAKAGVVKMAEEIVDITVVVPVEKAAEAIVEKTVDVPVVEAALDVRKSIDEAIERRTAKFDEAVTKMSDKLEAQEAVLKSLADSLASLSEVLKTVPAAKVTSVTKAQESGVTESKEDVSKSLNSFKSALSRENAIRMFPNR